MAADDSRPHRHARVVALLASLAAGACSVMAAQQPASDVESLMTRVTDRVVDYYRRARTVICKERATVQPIDRAWAPEGFARTVESEWRVEFEGDGDALPDVQVIREIRRINGREPRHRDKTARSGCTDPVPVSPDPLAFLLPAHQHEYRFTSVRPGKERDRAAWIIEFMSANRTRRLELIEDKNGHEDCFDWTGPLATRGRIWVDADTLGVLRVDQRMDAPADVRVPWILQRRYSLPPWVVIDRDELTIRYRAVAFSDPDELMVLPESVESLTLVRSALQSTRRSQTYSSYRRFRTSGRIVKRP